MYYVNRIRQLCTASAKARSFAMTPYPRSAVLIVGQSSIHSLLPSTLFAQAESLLQNGRLAEAQTLLKRVEADLAQGSTSSDDQVGGVS